MNVVQGYANMHLQCTRLSKLLLWNNSLPVAASRSRARGLQMAVLGWGRYHFSHRET
jgi:hypothetical protein